MITKEQFIELLNSNVQKVDELRKDETYLVQIEVGDMPKEQLFNFLKAIQEKFKEFGLEKTLLVPVYNGVGSFKFIRVKDGKLFDLEEEPKGDLPDDDLPWEFK